MAKLKMTAAVTSQVQLAEGIYDLRLAAGEIAAQAVPGQFVSLYSKDGSRLLRIRTSWKWFPIIRRKESIPHRRRYRYPANA